MSTVTADYALQAVKGIKESFDNGVNEIMSMYQDLGVVDMYTTPETFEIYTSTEGLSGTIQLSDYQTPPSSVLNDGYSVTITEDRFGNAIEIPEKIWRREGLDRTIMVDKYVTRQRNALLVDVQNKLITDYHLFFTDAFNGTYLTGPDGLALASASHAWATSGSSTWDNYDTQALDSDAIDSMETYAGAFTDASGKPMPLTFDTILVKKGTEAARTAKRLFNEHIMPTAIDDINIYEGGTYRVVETPYISTGTHWFGISSRLENPLKLAVGEAPTIRDGIVDKNQAIFTPCTGFWKKGIVNAPFAIYCSDGTT